MVKTPQIRRSELEQKARADRGSHLPPRNRSRHQCPDAAGRQDAGHSPARQPGRGSDRATEV